MTESEVVASNEGVQRDGDSEGPLGDREGLCVIDSSPVNSTVDECVADPVEELVPMVELAFAVNMADGVCEEVSETDNVVEGECVRSPLRVPAEEECVIACVDVTSGARAVAVHDTSPLRVVVRLSVAVTASVGSGVAEIVCVVVLEMSRVAE